MKFKLLSIATLALLVSACGQGFNSNPNLSDSVSQSESVEKTITLEQALKQQDLTPGMRSLLQEAATTYGPSMEVSASTSNDTVQAQGVRDFFRDLHDIHHIRRHSGTYPMYAGLGWGANSYGIRSPGYVRCYVPGYANLGYGGYGMRVGWNADIYNSYGRYVYTTPTRYDYISRADQAFPFYYDPYVSGGVGVGGRAHLNFFGLGVDASAGVNVGFDGFSIGAGFSAGFDVDF